MNSLGCLVGINLQLIVLVVSLEIDLKRACSGNVIYEMEIMKLTYSKRENYFI